MENTLHLAAFPLAENGGVILNRAYLIIIGCVQNMGDGP